MKNVIIILLSILVVFLLLFSIGAFRHSDIMERDEYSNLLRKRVAEVSRAQEWNIGIAASVSDPIDKQVIHGIRIATEIVNREGGVLGREIRLLLEDSRNSFSEHKFLVQDFCGDFSTVMLIGAFSTQSVKSSRSITQFHGLPLLSPTAAIPERLPPLTPELFFSVHLPLLFWTIPIIQELRNRQCKRVLILAQENSCYGGVFASHLENAMEETHAFTDIFRNSFNPPAGLQTFYQMLSIFQENRIFDAIVFSGGMEELAKLGQVMTKLNITLPVFCTEFSDSVNWKRVKLQFPSGLYTPKVSGMIADSPQFEQEWRRRFGSEPGLWEQYGALSIFFFARALESCGRYEPEELVYMMREEWRMLIDRQTYSLQVQLENRNGK